MAGGLILSLDSVRRLIRCTKVDFNSVMFRVGLGRPGRQASGPGPGQADFSLEKPGLNRAAKIEN